MKRRLLTLILLGLMGSGLFAQTGTVKWEKFKPAPATFPLVHAASSPAETRMLTSIDAPVDVDDSYAARITGYIVPAQSGSYTFYVASDDQSELWLSTNILPANAVKICSVSSWTSHNQFDKESGQASVSVSLDAGNYYYFEAMMMEGGGGDNLSVGWKVPGSSTIQVIGSAYISNEAVIDSTLTEITSFEFKNLGIPCVGTVDKNAGTVNVHVPYTTDLIALTPTVKASYGATINPASGSSQNFSSPKIYTVTSADGKHHQDYTVSVTVDSPRSFNEITDPVLVFPQVSVNGIVDNSGNTVTFNIYSGLAGTAVLNFTKDYFAQSSAASGSTISFANFNSLEITAQDGSKKTYSLVYNFIPGVAGFNENFSNSDFVSNWSVKNWNNSGNGNIFTISYVSADENLKITKNNSVNDYIVFTFPETLNLGLVSPKVRFQVKSANALTGFGAKLQDSNAPANDGNFSVASQNLSIPVLANGTFQEAVWDFSGKMETINPFLVKYLVLSVDRTISTELTDVRIDNFRVGAEAYANKKPTVDVIPKPAWKYKSDGIQNVTITGISDGNAERDEIVTITAHSSNQSVVADEDISVTYDGTSPTAQLSYSAKTNGTTIITVTLKDNHGTVYSDEADTQTTSFVAEFRDNTPGVNDGAIFGSVQFTHYNVGAGHQHVAIIAGVDDGDDDVVQKLFFSFTNNSTDKVIIDSINYNSGSSYALLYFHDKGITGNASVTLKCIDETDQQLANTPFSMNIEIPLGIYDTYGVNYGATQVAFWNDMPYKQDPVFKDGYPQVYSTANIVDVSKEDMFWGKMWGYIIAPVTGQYKFYSYTEGEGLGNFYLSTDETRAGLPAVGAPTAVNEQASSFINLVAGKAYYFEAFHKEIINDYLLRLEWVYPGISSPVVLQQPYLFSMLDLVLPVKPGSLMLVKKGSNQAMIKWNASTDNLKVSGYYVYVNGMPYNTEALKKTELLLEGLNPDTDYDIFVMAADQLKNYSKPSDRLHFKTWGVDVNPPSVPGNVTIDAKTTFSLSLSWSPSSDQETEVFGYNIYVNGSSVPVNSVPVITTNYKVNGLDMESDYSFSVTAVDASFNESEPGSVSGTTNQFVWDDASEDAHIAKVTMTWDPLVPSTGFAVEGDFGLQSILVSNKISYGSFEGSAFINNMGSTALTSVGKSKSAGVTFYAETNNAFHGSKCARLEVGPNDWFKNSASIVMTPDYNYLVRFAAKKGTYSGNINVKVYRETGGTVTAYTGSVTPTSDWKMYELEFPGIQDASTGWLVEFSFTALGTVYLDDVQLHVKEWYLPDSKFSKAGLDILDELKPAAVRWGAIDANTVSFSEAVGPYQKNKLTLGDFAALGARYNGYALLTVGVNTATDWISNPNTFKNFIEYLAGPAGTTWGDVRISEGYTQPFDQQLKGIVIEMGNEVWGFDAHGANAFSSSYSNYGPWAKNMTTNYIKASPYFNSEKMFVSYSGRSPDENYGLHSTLFKDDKGEMDMFSVSGYLGGNLKYDPTIDPGESQLDYHKNSYAVFYNKLKGLESITKEMFQYMGRNVPMYMYEGNLTTSEYHGTVGQAVTFADYYTGVMEYGVTLPDVFTLEGGEWRILDNNITLKKRPLYYMVQYFNDFCAGGVMLKNNFESVDKIQDYTGINLKLNSVGSYFFNKDDKYGIALFSRDFENDYVVQLDLPDDIGAMSEGEMVVISGSNYNSLDATVVKSDITLKDGMLIKVPKYSAIFIRFKADSRTYDPMPKLGEYHYKKVESIDLYTADGSTLLSSPSAYKRILYTVNPADAFYTGLTFEVIENSANASFALNRNVKADGHTNGTITVRAKTGDGSGVYSDITFTVTGQAVSVNNQKIADIELYPNPVKDILNIDFGIANPSSKLRVRNVLGNIVSESSCNESKKELDLSGLKSGIYFLEITSDEGKQIFRIIKQ